jgi:TRAP-type C4-dicarboxylate transport system permease small subunit
MQRAFFVIVMLLIMAGIIWLQIFLSKKQNKWLGLIIPLICFMFSIMIVLSLTMYTNTATVTEKIGSVVVSEGTITSQPVKPSITSTLATILPVFLMSNISTLIFLAIYFACREKRKKNLELEKMNIQDLE